MYDLLPPFESYVMQSIKIFANSKFEKLIGALRDVA